ncbi:unnamed protein product [Urochloa humidicola]
MVLGLCSCFGASPVAVAGKKPAPAAQQLVVGGEQEKKTHATGDLDAAAGEAGELKMAVDRSMVVKEKTTPPPVVVHQFPFHSHPGLL